MPEAVLKVGWTRVTFGDVVRLSRQRSGAPELDGFERYVGLDHIEPGDLTLQRWGDISDGTTFTNVFRAGQTLFGKRRAYQRKIAVADFDGVCSSDIYVLEPKNDRLLPSLLPFICQSDSFFEHAVGTSAGSLSPRTNWDNLASYEFALPPLEVQERVLSELGAAQQVLRTTAALHDAAMRLLASLEKRYFIEQPEGDVMEIRQVADVRNGTTPRRNRADYWGGNVPWLPTGKVNDRYIVSADQFITAQALSECSLTVIPRGATLVAMIGEGQTRGRSAFLNIDAAINQNFAAVVPDASVDSRFLFYLLESQYEALRHWSQGTNQHALNCELVGSFRVRIPTIAEQRQIATVLTSVETASATAAARLSETRFLFNSICSLALGG